jgi:hydrogenase maturation protein HypF
VPISNLEIRVRGTVQGVGFRPCVWRLANEEGLTGEVLNDGAGVLIRAAGSADPMSRFLERLQREAPPLSKIESIHTAQVAAATLFDGFRITDSVSGENRTRVTPDAATCATCTAEILDSKERRHDYPFANCTHCGPRFSIVRAVPYDRSRTTMSGFPMCSGCAREYGDPADRRFHAQAIACALCGPRIWFEPLGPRSGGASSEAPPRGPVVDDALAAAVKRLERGEIVAIRGLGGFHLACDATSADAVGRLRLRKVREGKPFAVMASDVEMARRYCQVSRAEAELLASPEAPIVLLERQPGRTLPDGIAPGLETLGIMLPYTPLHRLLLGRIGRPLVMTSGNLSNEPQITDIEVARAKLRGVADALVLHDRDIANRIDDSVVRFMGGRPRLLRRARGYAPSAIALPRGFEHTPQVLAYGGELKSVFCLLHDGAAILSQHQGDLEDVDTFDDYRKNLGLYAAMYEHRPQVLAADLHPEYLSTQLAHERAAADPLPVIGVQHHHAHIASCMVENGLPIDIPRVLGVAIDGLGFGEDGALWGGEFLLADYRSYERVGAFKSVAMAGGAQAIREPWRNTYCHLVAAIGWARFKGRFGSLDLVRRLEQRPLVTIDRMLERGINVPLASSCGRLFDAVAAAVGLCADRALFEGQGAMELEAVAGRAPPEPEEEGARYAMSIVVEPGTHLLRFDPAPMWWALAGDLSRAVPVSVIAARFHHGLARSIAAMVHTIVRRRGAHGPPIENVVVSGGCFQNKRLLEEVVSLVQADGLTCLSHGRVPSNDGGLALGQAAIAAARTLSPRIGCEQRPVTSTNSATSATTG